tara:strand:- start:34 stop:900 length:867 start_codon:yes stop_codon:yes gene_type:complete
MQTIIGLGKAGCNIADQFATYPQYKIYKIDTDLKKEPRCYSFPKYNHPEKYEENCPPLKRFFKNIKDDVLLITSCGSISAAVLRILEQIKHKCQISVLYIRADRSLLPELKARNDNVIFHVLQEYARSALFERIYLIDNAQIGKIIGNVPIREHFKKINELIAHTIHMMNVFNNSETEVSTFSPFTPTARMSTFSLLDYETGEEKLFFDLDIPREKRYYYGVPEKLLQTDKTLLKKISDQLKEQKQYDKMKMSYGVFSTNYKDIYAFILLNSSVVQNNKFRLDKELNL